MRGVRLVRGTLTAPPTDRAMWQRLLAWAHPERAGELHNYRLDER
jgi:hypothetical protein